MATQNARQKIHKGEQVARQATTSQAVIILARAGYAVKGVIYVVIGFLSILLVTGHGGNATDRNGALEALYHNPLGEGFGRVLLVILALGLFGFALWNLIQAVFDTNHKGNDLKGIGTRLSYFGQTVSYGGLGVVATQLAFTGAASRSGGSSTDSAQSWTGLLLQKPGGVFLVILVGLIVLCIVGYLVWAAVRAKFTEMLDLSAVSSSARKFYVALGRCGYIALGVVFAIVGIFLIVAAIKHDPKDARGLDSALLELLNQPFGPFLLGVVALGLLAYGAYSFVEARYRKVGN